MPWAALSIAALVAICAIIGCVLIAVQFSTNAVKEANRFVAAHRHTLETLERIHDKNMKQLADMADRFMSLDFTAFKAYQGAAEAEEGSFEEPEPFVRVERPRPDGRTAVVGAMSDEELAATANERTLLAEDFPSGWDE